MTNASPDRLPAVLYEKAKLVVEGEAEANGSISVLFTPEGGKATTLSIDVLKDTNKDDIAKAIHTKIALAAGEQFKVKASGQEIKIEQAKEKKGPKFSMSVEKIAVPGVSVLVKKA